MIKKLYAGNLAFSVFQTTPPNEPTYAIYFFAKLRLAYLTLTPETRKFSFVLIT